MAQEVRNGRVKNPVRTRYIEEKKQTLVRERCET